MKIIRSMGIRKKALCSITVLFLFTMLAELSLFYYISVRSNLKEAKQNGLDRLDNIGTYLDSYMEEIDSIAKDVNYNYYIQNYLAAAIQEEDRYTEPSSIINMREYEMSSQAFSNTLLEHSDIVSIMVFGKKKMLFHRSLFEYRNIIMDYSQEEWYKNAVDHPYFGIVTGPHHLQFLNTTESIISLSREIQNYDDGTFLGVVLINLNLNKIAEICEAFQTDLKASLCLTNEKGDLIYQQKKGEEMLPLSGEKGTSDLQKLVETCADKRNKVILNGTEYFVLCNEIPYTGWKMYSIEPYAVVMEELYQNAVLVIIAMVLLFIFSLTIIFIVLTGIMRPIEKLQRHMERVNLENLNQQVPVERADEIGKLSNNFNEMLERIKVLKEELLREQEDKRLYELQALQAQINPHFLYNTLDSIIWMAETKDPNVVAMTEALAKLFRISLNKGEEEISLEREMEHVKNYLIIQTMRYAEKFTYEIQINSEVRKCRVIKLIVQPIVENCIYHGIKKKPGKGHISISAFSRENQLVIQVNDDGCGMEEEVRSKILSDEIQTENISGSGIGVRNVQERIRLRFGKQYGLTYYSEPGKGTLVEYVLPLLDEEGNVIRRE